MVENVEKSSSKTETGRYQKTSCKTASSKACRQKACQKTGASQKTYQRRRYSPLQCGTEKCVPRGYTPKDKPGKILPEDSAAARFAGGCHCMLYYFAKRQGGQYRSFRTAYLLRIRKKSGRERLSCQSQKGNTPAACKRNALFALQIAALTLI